MDLSVLGVGVSEVAGLQHHGLHILGAFVDLGDQIGALAGRTAAGVRKRLAPNAQASFRILASPRYASMRKRLRSSSGV